jgi:hypothetical protein
VTFTSQMSAEKWLSFGENLMYFFRISTVSNFQNSIPQKGTFFLVSTCFVTSLKFLSAPVLVRQICDAGQCLRFLIATISLLLILFPINALSQSVSGLTGTVTDLNGAIIPGATVTLFDTKTKGEVKTAANNQGVYVFTNVKPGPGYRLTVSANNFQTMVLNEVTLGIAVTATQNIVLKAGQITEKVEVNSTVGDLTLNTTDASIGQIIGTQELRELPIQFRNSPAALIGLQPGVIGDNAGSIDQNTRGSVTGARADQGNITVDGIDANDQATQEAFFTVGNATIDSIEEFRSVSTNPNASEGRSSGGQIQLATKSGANEFHGSLREYYRTDKTAANTFFNNKFGLPRPRLNRHQFGGSLGGPLPILNPGQGGPMFKSGKNKLFFFFDYERRWDDSERSVLRIVPLKNFREGVIGYLNNGPGCSINSRLDTAPNCISFLLRTQAAVLDPKGIGINQNLLSLINQRYPVANDFSSGNGINTGGFRFNAPSIRQENTYTGRLDWNITAVQRLFARMTATRRNSTYQEVLFPGDSDSQSFIDNSYSWAAGHSWIISPAFFNQATIGISNSILDFGVPTTPSFPNIFALGAELPDPFSSLVSQARTVVTPTIRDDVTLTRNSHSIQFGGQFKPIRQKSTLTDDFNFVLLGNNGTELSPELRPSDILSDSLAGARFDSAFTSLLGKFSSIRTNFNYDRNGKAFPPGTGRERDYVYNEYELYFQDNWKIRRDLSLNLGMRWYFYPAPYEKNGLQSGNDVDFQDLWNQRLRNAAAGISGAGAETFLSYALNGKANGGKPLYQSDWNNFGPRIGFAYNPSFKGGILRAVFGDRRTVLRGGASILYDRVGGAMTFIQDQHTYIFDNSAVTNFGGSDPVISLLTDPRFSSLTSLPVQNIAPTITNPNLPYVTNGQGTGLLNFASNYAVARDFETPYSYQWSFGIQRELPGNMLLDVSYVGRKGRQLLDQSNAAQIVNFIDPQSGQSMLNAFNGLQSEIKNGVPLFASTPQPWIENQVGPQMKAAWGVECTEIGFPSCTDTVRAFMQQFVETGNTPFLIYLLNAFGILPPNVGLSSQFAINTFITNQASSDYDGMLLSLQKRFSKGFKFDVNYTWSHAFDTNSSITNSSLPNSICDLRNLRSCRSEADFDIRHLFSANGIWEVPFGRGRGLGSNINKWLDAFAGGWSVSGILTMRSGLPVNSFFYPFFIDQPVLAGDRATFAANIHDQNGSIQYFADPQAANGALRYPHHGETGSRNIFRGPGFWNLDLVVAKKWKMPWAEKHLLTLRVEAYNATNSNSFDNPETGFNSPSFGRIASSSSTPRTVQFGVRLDF